MFNEQGRAKVYNLPGAAGGETNGLYAAVTENEIVPMDTDYFKLNTPEPFNFWEDIEDIIHGAGGAYEEYLRRQAEAERIRREAERAAQPTMGDQFASLSFWEQAAFVLAIAGFAFVVMSRR